MVVVVKYKYIRNGILLFAILTTFLSLFAFYGRYSSAGAPAQPDDAVYVPIIMYHEIKTYKTGKDVITPYEFESDLKYLRDHDYHTVTMTQLIDYVYGKDALPENPIVLSFDDGYLNTYEYAFPLLEKYQMKIVFSIIGKNTDDFTQIPDDNLDYSHVTWYQLNDMLDSGLVEVQNHTYNMHNMAGGRIGCMQRRSETSEKYEQVLTDDVGKLQDEIIENTGTLPNTFTYPYGKSSKNTEEILKKLGFQATLTCDYGINVVTDDPESLFGLKRICRSHGDTIKEILTKAQKTL